jgi:GAF domain-containing protein
MSENQNLVAAATAFLGEAETEHGELLASVVRVARALFGAAAASVFLLDDRSGDLVFEAVSGAGESHLIGQRFPASRGIAGWVLGAQEPLVVSDLGMNPVFARDLAQATGYVPRTMMAAPLLYHGEPVGVMEVLDPTPNMASPLGAADLLTLFAGQAAIALGVIRRNRAAHRILSAQDGEQNELSQIARFLDQLGDDQRAASADLLSSLTRLLSAR